MRENIMLVSNISCVEGRPRSRLEDEVQMDLVGRGYVGLNRSLAEVAGYGPVGGCCESGSVRIPSQEGIVYSPNYHAHHTYKQCFKYEAIYLGPAYLFMR
jgi:hypothetical protein